MISKTSTHSVYIVHQLWQCQGSVSWWINRLRWNWGGVTCHIVTSRSCDGMWNMKHEEWCHKWCHMEKGYKHGKSFLNQGLRYIFRIIKAWRPCKWQKGINKIENKRIMRIKKRYSWIYLTGKWIPYKGQDCYRGYTYNSGGKTRGQFGLLEIDCSLRSTYVIHVAFLSAFWR